MPTYIVTGAAGFIGSHLSRALTTRGDRVVGVDNFDGFYARSMKEANIADLDRGRFELIESDIRDAPGMAVLFDHVRPDGVFHIAALAGVRPSIVDPGRYAGVNVDGLISVLEAARTAGCPRVVFASSSSVYGNASRVPFSESDPVDEPISPYAATKRAGELICHTYCHLYGLAIACLRFFTVYGPAQRPDLAISKFMRLMSEGEPIPMFGDGRTSRDYTYIDDIIRGVLASDERAAAQGPGYFRIYNLGGAHPITLADMIASIGRVVGVEPRIEHHDMQPGDVERTFADVARSRDELRFDATIDFETGLARQWEWLKAVIDQGSVIGAGQDP